MNSESATQSWREIGRTMAAGTLSEEIRSSHGYMKVNKRHTGLGES